MVATYPFSLLLKAPRPIKKLIVLTADVVMMVIILNLLMIIRQGHLQFYVPWPSQGFIYGITLVCLLLSGVYQAVLRAFDDRLMKNVLLALAAFLAVVETLRYVGWLTPLIALRLCLWGVYLDVAESLAGEGFVASKIGFHLQLPCDDLRCRSGRSTANGQSARAGQQSGLRFF
jgi:hypothetical protein